MTEEQFDFELGRHGGDLARWPADKRAEAEALIARSPEAACRQREALRLDRLLALTEPMPVENEAAIESLIERITTLPQESAPAATRHRRVMTLRYAACVVAALAGFGLGALQSREARMPADLLDLAFGAPTGDFDVQ